MHRQLDLISQELEDKQSLLDRHLMEASRVLQVQREHARLTGEIGQLNASSRSFHQLEGDKIIRINTPYDIDVLDLAKLTEVAGNSLLLERI